jgi:hypothetical protein
MCSINLMSRIEISRATPAYLKSILIVAQHCIQVPPLLVL